MNDAGNQPAIQLQFAYLRLNKTKKQTTAAATTATIFLLFQI